MLKIAMKFMIMISYVRLKDEKDRLITVQTYEVIGRVGVGETLYAAIDLFWGDLITSVQKTLYHNREMSSPSTLQDEFTLEDGMETIHLPKEWRNAGVERVVFQLYGFGWVYW